MIAALREVIEECSLPGWDGYGAEPVDPASASMVDLFVGALPARTEAPKFGVDPDGEVSMEWYAGRNHLFSISMRRDGDLSYAWICEDRRGCGSDYFDGKEVPRALLCMINVLSP